MIDDERTVIDEPRTQAPRRAEGAPRPAASGRRGQRRASAESIGGRRVGSRRLARQVRPRRRPPAADRQTLQVPRLVIDFLFSN